MNFYILQDMVLEWVVEWVVIVSAISGIGYGIYRGIEEYSTFTIADIGYAFVEGIKSAFVGFFVVGIFGGVTIGIITAAITILIGATGHIAEITEAVANSIPFGWIFVSVGFAISVFMGITIFKNQEEDDKYKILKTLLTVPLSYVAFGIITIIVAGVTKAVANSLPSAWFFVSIGCAASVFVGITIFRNQEEGDKYKILKALLITPLSYAAFGIIAFIAAEVTKAVANSLPLTWLFISIGCSASVFVGFITFRNQGDGDKYKILKTLMAIPLLYVAFGIITIIVAWVTKAVAVDDFNPMSLPFGWFFVSTGCAISILMGIKSFRDESNSKDKAINLLIIPFSYIAFMIIAIIIAMITEYFVNSLPFGWFFVSTGFTISVFMGVKAFRNYKFNDKYNALKKIPAYNHVLLHSVLGNRGHRSCGNRVHRRCSNWGIIDTNHNLPCLCRHRLHGLIEKHQAPFSLSLSPGAARTRQAGSGVGYQLSEFESFGRSLAGRWDAQGQNKALDR